MDDIAKIKTCKMDDKSTKPLKRKLVWKNIAVYTIGHALGIYGIKIWLFDITWTHTIVSIDRYTRWPEAWPLEGMTADEVAKVFVNGWVARFGVPSHITTTPDTPYALSYFINLNGILMGAHRYYAHRSFKASKAMQVIMLIAQTAASQNCMWVWVRDHRQHHKYSDTDADPHNATNGFFFSHVGWLLSKKHPEVAEKGKGIDMSDLDADPLVMFQKRHYFKLWFAFAFVMPLVIPVFVFRESLMKSILIWIFARLVLALNFTWLVNSWAHLYGTRPYDKSIQPVETYFVSFVTGGEGWHNYHHAFPWDYKAAEFGTPLNWVSSYIRFCAHLGLVWDLKAASDDMIVSRASRTGDGTPIRTKNVSENRKEN